MEVTLIDFRRIVGIRQSSTLEMKVMLLRFMLQLATNMFRNWEMGTIRSTRVEWDNINDSSRV